MSQNKDEEHNQINVSFLCIVSIYPSLKILSKIKLIYIYIYIHILLSLNLIFIFIYLFLLGYVWKF